MLVAFICIPELWSIYLKWISGVDELGLNPALKPKLALLLPTLIQPPPVTKSVEQGGLGGHPGQPCTSLWALDRITSAVTTLSAVTVRWIAFTVMSCVPPPVEVFCSLMTSLATPGMSNVWFGAKGSTVMA